MNAACNDLVVDARGVARFRGRRFSCSIGRSGIVKAKTEGDGGTPTGSFHLEQIYYRADRGLRPKSLLPTTAIRTNDGWSDDPSDRDYNHRVSLPYAYRHETLRRGDWLYDIVVVFDANRAPVVPGAGSALFLHLRRNVGVPTEGCIAFARPDLEWILENWTLKSRLVVNPQPTACVRRTPQIQS
ncbi:MAG: L,D-transpeptidase family protein [Pseudomonadota bacterium]